MDSIGIDENNCPVIFEYKRSVNENVINQGLFYLDWLLDHKADFKLLVMDILGQEKADEIDWSMPCVICIANDFKKVTPKNVFIFFSSKFCSSFSNVTCFDGNSSTLSFIPNNFISAIFVTPLSYINVNYILKYHHKQSG